jgi:hypothetical protein
MIAALYNIPSDPPSMSRFAFHNRDQHRQVTAAVEAKFGLTLPEYPIDPIASWDFTNWLYNHQAMHNAVNGLLGTAGNDLTDVDPTKPDQLSAWIQLHAVEHVQWGNILGIG